jgi:hypothetical protein
MRVYNDGIIQTERIRKQSKLDRGMRTDDEYGWSGSGGDQMVNGITPGQASQILVERHRIVSYREQGVLLIFNPNVSQPIFDSPGQELSRFIQAMVLHCLSERPGRGPEDLG